MKTVTALAALLFAFTATAGEISLPAPPASWESKLDADNALAGRIVRVTDGRSMSAEGLAEALALARFVLLSETHDNPDHHRLQAWAVEALTAQGRRPAVVFEMLDSDQAPALDAYLDDHPRDPAGLGEAVGWTARGWPAWATYQPIAQAAMTGGLPLRTGDVDPETQERAARAADGEALSTTESGRLALDLPLSDAAGRDLRRALKEGHCNMLPDAALAPMARVQRLRDAVMADSLIAADAATGDGAVLIAGREHVRTDRGVPWYLRKRGVAGAGIVTLGIFEVQPGQTTWRASLPEGADGRKPLFDYVWFTPRFDDTDHCAELRKRMETRKDGDATQ